ncbi:MAG: Lon protease C-terminal proteolytic domain-containing protein [Monoraphidium minutum]|nr:MAG: Lon protease C-terminal proteolytic domain-containing protein [Monoraphidium minutum]
MALRQQARRAVLVARIVQGQANARQQALTAQRRSPGDSVQQQRASSSSSKDDESSWGLKMFKGLRGDKKAKAQGAAGGEAAGASGGAGGAAEGVLVPSSPELKHRKVFVVELSRKPLFPGIYTPVLVLKNEKLIKEVMEAKKHGGQAYVGAFLKKPEKGGAAAAAEGGGGGAEGEDPAGHLFETGTFAQVHTILSGDTTDSAQLLLLGHRRLKRETTVSGDPLRVAVTHLKDEPYANDDITKATSMEIVNTMKDLLNMNPLYGEQFRTLMTLTGSIDLNDLSRLVDAAASLTSAEDSVLQARACMEMIEFVARLVLELLKKEVELCRLQADIREQVESKIMKEQRRMILMEQLKSIKRELGLEKDDKAALIGRFQTRWEPRKPFAPEDVGRVVQEELDKLAGLEPVSPEFNVTRNYLDWLTGLPWGEYTQEIFDIEHAKQVLDEDHYGLEDVKNRILEFIAVSRLRGSAQGKILCLSGPPGVGKTSIGRSIARTLGRKYYRFSVGGLYDVAEIKGHRRTYVGAMPGKMVQCLKSTGSSNPLVLIDEIDKLGRGHTGDPASALLELLDPEQNSGFLDHYLDVPIDLSKVLFVCTANVLDTIPGPLLDRMEVIRLSGYASDEKTAIARSYLEPQARTDAGVPPGAVEVTDGAMGVLIDQYCREAGVRNLKKHLEKLYRKAALKLVQEYVGLPPFAQDRFYESTPEGVVMGLAWTAMGGATLYVEAARVLTGEGKGSLITTGQLGDVMRESATIAHTYARAFLERVAPGSKFFSDTALHVHVPQGATPKDGPSAGCTIITALLSLALNKPVARDLAMTGEVTLTGRVLPIGGVKEKLLAARRSGVAHVIFPEGNRRDYEEVAADLKAGITPYFVSSYDQVYELALGGGIQAAAAAAAAEQPAAEASAASS